MLQLIKRFQIDMHKLGVLTDSTTKIKDHIPDCCGWLAYLEYRTHDRFDRLSKQFLHANLMPTFKARRLQACSLTLYFSSQLVWLRSSRFWSIQLWLDQRI